MKRILTFTLLAWLMAAPAWAAITFDAASVTTASASSTSHSHTFAGDANIAIICVASFEGTGAVQPASGVTVGGQAATLLISKAHVGLVSNVDLFYKLSPLTGAQTVAATGDATTDKMVTGVMSFKSVAQASTFNTTSNQSGSGSGNVNLDSIASAVGEMGVSCSSVFTSDTTTASADATAPVSTEGFDAQVDAGAGSSLEGFGYYEAGAVTSINMRVDLTTSPPGGWAMVGVSMRPAAASTRRPVMPIIFQ